MQKIQRSYFRNLAVILQFVHKVFRKLKVTSCAEKIQKVKIRATAKSASNDQINAFIGDHAHKLFQEALGQTIQDNQFALKTFLDEAEHRKLTNSIVEWGKQIYSDYKNDNLVEGFRNNNTKEIIIDFKKLDDFALLAGTRQSIRKFKPTPISETVIMKLLASGIAAPSSCNRQSWRFKIFTSKVDKAYIANIRNVNFLKDAPLIICVLINTELYRNRQEARITGYMDASAASMNIITAATASGLGSCWVNFIASIGRQGITEFKKRFKIHNKYEPINLIAIGHPSQNIVKPRRLDVSDYILP